MQAAILRSHRLVISFLFLTLALPAQSPAPMAETARSASAAWTADDAMAWQVLQSRAAELQKGGKAALPLVLQDMQRQLQGMQSRSLLPAHAMVAYPIDGDAFADHGHGQPDQPFVLYFWPKDAQAARVFCLLHDGRLLSAANTAHYADNSPPLADAATGAGSRGRPADLLTTPGKGRDGQLWETAAMAPARSLQLELRDDQGRPVPNGRIALAPRSWVRENRQIWLPEGPDKLQSLEVPLPAGQTETDAKGKAELQGIWVKDLIACVGEKDGTALALPTLHAHVEAGRLVLTLPLTMLRTAQFLSNESAAIATLKNISSAQAQCQACAVIDANQNGAGEYGYFGELAGALPVRKDSDGGVGTTMIAPPVLSRAFAKVEGSRVVRSGYVFQIFLPSKTTTGVIENTTGGGAGAAVDAQKAEVMWCCYAWPQQTGVTGKRAFFINQAGDVLSCRNEQDLYSGADKAPLATAAFAANGTGAMDSAIAANVQGKDGQGWVVVN